MQTEFKLLKLDVNEDVSINRIQSIYEDITTTDRPELITLLFEILESTIDEYEGQYIENCLLNLIQAKEWYIKAVE